MKHSGIFLTSLLLFSIIPVAYGQLSIDSKLDELEREGKPNCEITQFNEYFYLPVRIEIEHNRASAEVTTSSSDLSFEKKPEQFILVTSKKDRFVAEVMFTFDSTNTTQKMNYRIYNGENGQLSQEGNWYSDKKTFCKIISFHTTEEPEYPKVEELAKEVKDDVREQINTLQTDFSTFVENYGWLAYAIIGIAIFVGIMIIVFADKLKKISDKVTKPIEKYTSLNKKFENLISNMKLIAKDNTMERESDRKELDKVINEMNKTIADLQIVGFGLTKKIDTKDAFPKPSTLITVPKGNPDYSFENRDASIDAMSEQETKQYLSQFNKDEMPFIVDDVFEPNTAIIKTSPMKDDVQVESVSVKAVTPSTEQTEQMMKNNLKKSNDIDVDEKQLNKLTGYLDKFKHMIAKKQEEKKPETIEEWKKYYFTKSRSENEQENEVLRAEYSITPTRELYVKIKAIFEVLITQV